jgi:predicted HAD superfamily Cof-like phosphohydrolase
MSEAMIKNVFEFNKTVVGIPERDLEPLGFEPGEKEWMVKALREEASELEESTDLINQVDALIDSIIFAIGGLYRLGLSKDQALGCFLAVMEANFKKKAGVKAGRAIEGVKDAIKPEGWESPEIRIHKILRPGA